MTKITEVFVTAQFVENGKNVTKSYAGDTIEELDNAAFDIITTLFLSGELASPQFNTGDCDMYSIAHHIRRVENYSNALKVMNGAAASREVFGKRIEASPYHVLTDLPQFQKTITTHNMFGVDEKNIAEPNLTPWWNRINN